MSKHPFSLKANSRVVASTATSFPAPRQWIIQSLALLALALPLFGQEQKDLSEMLSGVTHSLSVKLKDLDNTWRRITVRSGGTVSGNVSVNVTGNSRNSDSCPVSQNNIVGAVGSSRTYVTRGQTMNTSGRVYLVAYHLPGGLDLGSLLQAVALKTSPPTAALTPDSELALSLLDLQTIGSLEDVRPFDMKAEIRESEGAAQKLTELLKAQGGGSQSKASPSSKASESKDSKD